MAEISKIKIGSNTYDIKDAYAREQIVGGVHYAGKTNTVLTDGATTKPIKIYNAETTTWEDYTQANGDIVIYEKAEGRHLEFIWNGNHWDEFGSTGELGSGAFMNLEEKEINLAHTHSLSYSDTKANVAFTMTDNPGGMQKVVTGATLRLDEASQMDGTVKVAKPGSVTFDTNPYIVVPDLKNNSYTPEGTIAIADGTETATTGGAVAYGTQDSDTVMDVTQGTTSLTHTNSATSTTTINGTQATYSVSGTISPTVTATAAVTNTQADCAVTTGKVTIAQVTGEVLTLAAEALSSVTAKYEKTTAVTPNVGVQIGAVELSGTGITGLTATTSTTVSIGDHTLIQGKVAMPELLFTAPKYIKWGKATFTGTAKATNVVYENNYGGNHYAAQYTEGMYKNYNGAPDGANLSLSGYIPEGTLAVVPTAYTLGGSVTYAKATSANSSLGKYTLIAKKA